MLYRQKFDTFIRCYGNIGYIVRKGNFSDRVTDYSGAIFLAALSRKGQTLEKLVEKISESFIGVDQFELQKDAEDFYKMLEDDGFIVTGETETELIQKDTRFSYTTIKPKTINKNIVPTIIRSNRNTSEILDGYFKDNPQIMTLQVELSSRCNERCIHCYIPHKEKICDINDTLFYNIIEQCRDNGVLNLTLSGGEPMIHPNFCDYLTKLLEYDFSITILSNLTLLTEEIISKMKDNRVLNVQTSLYSLKPAIHDAITTVPGSFEKTKDAILQLIKNDIPLKISCPVMKLNKDCYLDVLKWSHEHKCEAAPDYELMARYDNSTDNLNNCLSLVEVEKIIKDIYSTDDELIQEELFNAGTTIDKKIDASNEFVCGTCISSICIGANGTIYPCPGWQSYICGNIRETSLRETWENSTKIKYIRSLRKKDFPKCLKCNDKKFCQMCMLRNANENLQSDPLKIPERFCENAKLKHKIILEMKSKMQGKNYGTVPDTKFQD